MVAINRRTGTIAACLQLAVLGPPPADRSETVRGERLGDLGPRGRGGRARHRRILVATGNAPFDGRTNWGDSVLELAPTRARCCTTGRRPTRPQLNSDDVDLGSISPAVLAERRPRLASRAARTACCGSRPRSARRDHRWRWAAPRRRAAADPDARRRAGCSRRPPCGGTEAGRTCSSPTRQAPRRTCSSAAPQTAAASSTGATGRAGTSPIVAGGLLYVFDREGVAERVRADTGRKLIDRCRPAGPLEQPDRDRRDGWSCRSATPTTTRRTGTVDIYHLPRR